MFSHTHTEVAVLIVLFLSLTRGETQVKPKRQIYREQVLPSSGGKIPDGAFRTDRLALNKLNKAGISIPDGVLLEHRHVYHQPHAVQHDPEDEDSLVKIVQKPEDRYVPPEGAYHNERPLTVPSTYIIRKPTHATGIRTPPEQMPLHELLAAKQLGHVFRAHHAPSPPQAVWRPFKFENLIPPPIYAYHGASSYSFAEHPKPTVAYYPVTVPLEIPHKKTPKSGHHQGPSQHREPENVHSIVNWPYLLGEYTRLADEINAINHSPYGQSTQHSLFFTPEVVPPVESYYYGSKGRYARTSKEIPFTDLSPGNVRKVTSKDARTVIKLRCTLASDNAVDGHDAKCRLRH